MGAASTPYLTMPGFDREVRHRGWRLCTGVKEGGPASDNEVSALPIVALTQGAIKILTLRYPPRAGAIDA
jgi:hypothetical protein